MPHLFEIDDRHVSWLRNVLMSGKFKRVLEVGCWMGHSTQALLDALECYQIDEVHLVEPHPRIELEWRIAACKRKDRVHLHRTTSVQFLDRDTTFDFVFIDGDHRESVVKAELERLLPANISLVAAHDVGSAGRYEGCEGPQHLHAAYQKAGYLCCVDQVMREGERCERGLLMAARDLSTYRTVLGAYLVSC